MHRKNAVKKTCYLLLIGGERKGYYGLIKDFNTFK